MDEKTRQLIDKLHEEERDYSIEFYGNAGSLVYTIALNEMVKWLHEQDYRFYLDEFRIVIDLGGLDG